MSNGRVLRLYRRAMKLARDWEVPHEREYIQSEARRLVRMNRNIESRSVIIEKLEEFESRIETAVHYRIPYPRPVNVSPGATGKNPEFVTPVYLHSYQQSLGATGTPRKRVPNSPKYDE